MLFGPDLARDLRRGVLRGLLIIALPLAAIFFDGASQEELWGSLSLISVVVAVAAICVLEGRGRRAPANARFWLYIGIFALSGLLPFVVTLQAEYLVAVGSGETRGAVSDVVQTASRMLRNPMLFLFGVFSSGVIPTMISLARIRDEPYPTLATLKAIGLWGLPVVFFSLPGYLALLVWAAALSLAYSLSDWLEGLVFRTRAEGVAPLRARVERGEFSRRDLRTAAILGDPAALELSGESRVERGVVDLLSALQWGGPVALARAAHALTALTVPAAKDVEAARRAHQLAGEAIREEDTQGLEAELERWAWRRDAPPTARAIHCVLEAARSVETGWVATALRSAKDCAAAALELSTPEGARDAVTSALLPWALGEYDPLPERSGCAEASEGGGPASLALGEEEGGEPELDEGDVGVEREGLQAGVDEVAGPDSAAGEAAEGATGDAAGGEEPSSASGGSDLDPEGGS